MKQNNFYLRLQESTRADKKTHRRFLLRQALPPACLAAALIAVLVVLSLITASRQNRVDAIMDWTADPQIAADYQESISAQAGAGAYKSRTAALENHFANRATYPVVGSDVWTRIQDAGPDSVTVAFTSYDAATGVLAFDSRSEQVIDIPTYVVAMQNTGLFSAVSYTGYSLSDEIYTINMSCVMAAREEG